MSKFVFIKTANDNAYMNTVSNFRGAVHSGDTAVDLYFASAVGGNFNIYDKIALVVTTQKEQEVMEYIGGALAGTHTKGMVVIADDVASKYVNANITSVGDIDLSVSERRTTIESLTAAKVVASTDSGTTFVLNKAAGAAITLPTAAAMGAGFTCKFFVGTAFGTSNWQITATAAVIRGGVTEAEVDTSDDNPFTVAGTTIDFVHSLESLGDVAILECDGTNIFLTGNSKLDGAILLA